MKHRMTRKFNGQIFEQYSVAGSKKEATSDAEDVRKEGYNARIVTHGGGIYFVYAGRRKK